MAIGVRSHSLAGNAGAGSIAVPTGTQNGDLLLAWCITDPDGTVTDLTAPAGWTQIASDATAIRGRIFYKVASGESGTYAFGTSAGSDGAWVIVAFTGVDTTNPIQVNPDISGGTAATDLVAPSITMTGNGALVCCYGSQNAGTFTTPTGMTEIADHAPSGWAAQSICWESRTSGATGTRTSTHSVSEMRVWASLGLNEAGGGGPGPVTFVGTSNEIATNGGAPGAITPHASTATDDLLIFYHYSRATGGNETVTPPTGFTTVFNSVTANQGLVCVAWKIRQSGDTTYTATITNHTTGTSGETVLEWIGTFRGHDPAAPLGSFTSSLSTWSSSLNVGPVSAPSSPSLADRGMVVVFGGRFENITGQTTLTGDSLTWAQGNVLNTTLGLDAAAVTQFGTNGTGTAQTVTAKTITTTGTAQAGAGRMFFINAEPTGQTVVVGVASEIDTAQTVHKVKGVGAASETDTAQAVTRVKRLAVGIAAEADVALGVAKRKGVGAASEVDTAQAVHKRKGVGVAVETDAALAVARAKKAAVGPAAETDAAQLVHKRKGVGVASEVDSALLVRVAGKVVAVGIAAETDTALPIHKRKGLGIAVETDVPQAVGRVKVRTVGLASEADVALGIHKRKGVGVAAEVDAALDVIMPITTLVDITVAVGNSRQAFTIGNNRSGTDAKTSRLRAPATAGNTRSGLSAGGSRSGWDAGESRS